MKVPSRSPQSLHPRMRSSSQPGALSPFSRTPPSPSPRPISHMCSRGSRMFHGDPKHWVCVRLGTQSRGLLQPPRSCMFGSPRCPPAPPLVPAPGCFGPGCPFSGTKWPRRKPDPPAPPHQRPPPLGLWGRVDKTEGELRGKDEGVFGEASRRGLGGDRRGEGMGEGGGGNKGTGEAGEVPRRGASLGAWPGAQHAAAGAE